jgi:YHS domain-containing protein
MDVDEAKARAEGRTSEHQGRTYFFCNPGCKQTFDKDPAAHAHD